MMKVNISNKELRLHFAFEQYINDLHLWMGNSTEKNQIFLFMQINWFFAAAAST